MSNTSNFRQAIDEARGKGLVGPNVIANALPYLGGGLILTALGTYGGLGVINSRPDLFMPTFWVAMIAELVLFFVARGIAERGNKGTALPLFPLSAILVPISLCLLFG